jgi:hypothetical protein
VGYNNKLRVYNHRSDQVLRTQRAFTGSQTHLSRGDEANLCERANPQHSCTERQLASESQQGDLISHPMAAIQEQIKATPLQYIRKIKMHLQPRLEQSENGVSEHVLGNAMALKGSCFVSKILEKMVARGVVRHGCKTRVTCYETNAAPLTPARAPPMPQ